METDAKNENVVDSLVDEIFVGDLLHMGDLKIHDVRYDTDESVYTTCSLGTLVPLKSIDVRFTDILTDSEKIKEDSHRDLCDFYDRMYRHSGKCLRHSIGCYDNQTTDRSWDQKIKDVHLFLELKKLIRQVVISGYLVESIYIDPDHWDVRTVKIFGTRANYLIKE